MENNEIAHMYELWNRIYECDRCGQKYPHWMMDEKEWKKGVKKELFREALRNIN